MPALAAAPRAVPLRGTQSHIALQRTSVASASRPARQPRLAAKRRLVVASVQSVPSAVEAVQLEADWAEADREAEKKSAEFDVTASRPKIVCFRVKRILDLTIKEPLGPDGKTPKWPIENYCANPDNFVSMVYPPENVVKSDQYHFEIRLLKLRFFSWFIVPLYRLEMRYLPERGLLARSWDVTLDQDVLPALLKGIDLSMRMRSVTTVHRRSDEVGEFEDGSGSFRKTLLEANVNLEIATYVPKLVRILPGLTKVGDGILDTILVAIQGIVRDKLQEDYLRLIKLEEEKAQ